MHLIRSRYYCSYIMQAIFHLMCSSAERLPATMELSLVSILNITAPRPFILTRGEIKILNASDISQLFDYDELLFSGISKNDVIRSNGLPEGNYQVCVQAYDYNTDKLLSSQEPLGCSNIFSYK